MSLKVKMTAAAPPLTRRGLAMRASVYLFHALPKKPDVDDDDEEEDDDEEDPDEDENFRVRLVCCLWH